MYKQLVTVLVAAGTIALAIAPGHSFAAPHVIGEPKIRKHMEFRALYMQSGVWEPTVPRGADNSDDPDTKPDIHLELLVTGVDGNPWGFSKGDFIPYLKIEYTIAKEDNEWYRKGLLMAVATNNGPRYGVDIPMDGPGKYYVLYRIYSPLTYGLVRHTDREMGVPEFWTEPIEVHWKFTYNSVDKKGDY
jgi:hypothetical protein